ncbi:MAG: hypothetical protein PUE49_01265 [Eggerthellales bacterium]|nr:hypothetical protein [Eggerthellales bacterium]
MTKSSYTAIDARIGDDGCYMTKKRIIAHHSLNFLIVWGVLILLCTIIFAAVAYLQGQTLSQFELIASGGNMFKGYYTADLLRLEAAYCFFGGLILVGIHLYGFVWLYEQGKQWIIGALILASVSISVVWLGFMGSIGILEPISFVTLIGVTIFATSGFFSQKEKASGILDV